MDSQKGQKEQIVDVAARLFVEKGYKGISMREIAEAVGLSKAGIYHHFRDKEDLFLAVLTANLRRIEGLIEQTCREQRGTRERLRAILLGIFSLPLAQRAIIRLASQEMVALSPEVRHEFARLYRRSFIDRIVSILQEGIERGELRPVDPRLATWMLLGMAYPFLYPVHQSELGDPRETVEIMLGIFFEGVTHREDIS